MAFQSVQLVGNGDKQTAISNDNTYEAVVNALTIYNSTLTPQSVEFYIDSMMIFKEEIPSLVNFRMPDKINLGINTKFEVLAPIGVTLNVSYLQQLLDDATVAKMIKPIYDDIDNVDNVSQNMDAVTDVSTNIEAVKTAKQNALIAQSLAHYKGTWQSDYDSGNGYTKGDSVTYTDGLQYMSIIDSNKNEPESRTNTDSWIFIMSGAVGGKGFDCGGAGNMNKVTFDGGTAGSTYN